MPPQNKNKTFPCRKGRGKLEMPKLRLEIDGSVSEGVFPRPNSSVCIKKKTSMT